MWFLLFFSFLLEKGCKRGPQSCLWLRDVSIHHLSVVLADESVAVTSFGEERVLVMNRRDEPR